MQHTLAAFWLSDKTIKSRTPPPPTHKQTNPNPVDLLSAQISSHHGPCKAPNMFIVKIHLNYSITLTRESLLQLYDLIKECFTHEVTSSGFCRTDLYTFKTGAGAAL